MRADILAIMEQGIALAAVLAKRAGDDALVPLLGIMLDRRRSAEGAAWAAVIAVVVPAAHGRLDYLISASTPPANPAP